MHRNDIALIQLESKIEFSLRIRPACLHIDKEDLSNDLDLIIAGWGTQDSEGFLFANFLKRFMQ